MEPSLWEEFRTRFVSDWGSASFQNWMQNISFLGEREGVVSLKAPSTFIQEWVQGQYLPYLEGFFSERLPGFRCVNFVDPIGGDADVFSDTSEVERPSIEQASPVDVRCTFEKFVVDKSNVLAYTAAMRVCDSKAPPFNPLFIHGGVGLGKTHLMYAIANRIRLSAPHRKVVYLSAERFMYQFIRAIRDKDTVSFKERFRSVDVLMVDDVQFISDKHSTQEEFFHTFNALIEQGRQVVISADQSPSELQGLEERMQSRLGWGLVADIHTTTYELRLGILESKLEGAGVFVPKDILMFLAEKVTSNVRELEGALTRVLTHADLTREPLTVPMVERVLRDLLRSCARSVTVDDVQKTVADYYRLRVSDIQGQSRLRAVVKPRQVAMYISKELTGLSLPDIGRAFGGRDHTTVLHALRKIEEAQKNRS